MGGNNDDAGYDADAIELRGLAVHNTTAIHHKVLTFRTHCICIRICTPGALNPSLFRWIAERISAAAVRYFIYGSNAANWHKSKTPYHREYQQNMYT